MRFHYLNALIVAAVILSAAAANAGAPEVDPRICMVEVGGRNVEIPRTYEPSQQLFASVRRLPPAEREIAKQTGTPEYFIAVNPERYFIGEWTQQWLYLRQCAHITLGHPIRDRGAKGFNFADEESADCWAVDRLREDPGNLGFSRRALNDIERDVRYVSEEGLWGEILPGPERPVRLTACPNA